MPKPIRRAVRSSIQATIIVALCTPGVVSCAGGGDSPGPVRSAGSPGQSRPRNQPPALIGGESVTWTQMQPLLAEAAGGEVLEEIALDRMLEAEMAREGVSITSEDIQREEAALLSSLIQADVADDERQSRALLSDLRARRGLGQNRYSALLRRSAALRALVQDQIVLNDEVLRQTHELLHGARYDIRIIVVPNDPTLDAVSARLERGEAFAEVAARFSTHESANRGGLVQSLSVADPSLPTAVREAIRTMAPGEPSDAIALPTGYAFVLVEDVDPGDGLTLEMVQPEVELEARRTQERLRMGELATELLARANVAVFDQALSESWSARTR